MINKIIEHYNISKDVKSTSNMICDYIEKDLNNVELIKFTEELIKCNIHKEIKINILTATAFYKKTQIVNEMLDMLRKWFLNRK